jgi:hypothetical protein
VKGVRGFSQAYGPGLVLHPVVGTGLVIVGEDRRIKPAVRLTGQSLDDIRQPRGPQFDCRTDRFPAVVRLPKHRTFE